jgi:hypothetical protein
MNKFFGELITKYNKSGETPYKLNLYNSRGIPDYNGSTSYYRYNITINGNETERINYAYVIYYHSNPGDCLIPHCCFTDKNDADNFIKYWNDDNAILATGHYYLIKKVEVI